MTYVAVAIGGFIGACLRFGLSEWLGTYHGFPYSTLLINVIGSGFLAWFYTRTSEGWLISPNLRLGIGTGLVGAFTTFSTFTVDAWKLLAANYSWLALLYILLSLLLSIGFAMAGYTLAWRQSQLRFVKTPKED